MHGRLAVRGPWQGVAIAAAWSLPHAQPCMRCEPPTAGPGGACGASASCCALPPCHSCAHRCTTRLPGRCGSRPGCCRRRGRRPHPLCGGAASHGGASHRGVAGRARALCWQPTLKSFFTRMLSRNRSACPAPPGREVSGCPGPRSWAPANVQLRGPSRAPRPPPQQATTRCQHSRTPIRRPARPWRSAGARARRKMGPHLLPTPLPAAAPRMLVSA
jgi:hypothetical protein